MKFHFDESGTFAVPSAADQHAVGIVVGVDIPEADENEVFSRYEHFIGGLSKSELKNGEPKGNLLSEIHLRDFAEMLAACEGVLLNTTLLDLTSLADGRHQDVIQSMQTKLQATAEQCVHQTMHDQMDILRRQCRNLSPAQLLRIFAWAICLNDSLRHCILWRGREEYRDCWHEIEFSIDAVQCKEGSREREAFEKLLLGWLTAWSRENPITTVQEWHTADHPFVKLYETDDGIDLGRILRGNVKWRSSNDSLGLQIADIGASIVRRATRGLVDIETLRTYGSLMRRSVLSPKYAVGLRILTGVSEIQLGNRYAGLMEAISEARRKP
jgi:hypothetical protein